MSRRAPQGRDFWSGVFAGPTPQQTMQMAKAEAIQRAYITWVHETAGDPNRTLADCEAKYAELKRGT